MGSYFPFPSHWEPQACHCFYYSGLVTACASAFRTCKCVSLGPMNLFTSRFLRWSWTPSLTVGSLAEMELILFAVVGMGPCLGFVMKTVLITWELFCLLYCPARRWTWGVPRRLGRRQGVGRGNTAETDDPDWSSSFFQQPLNCNKDSKW